MVVTMIGERLLPLACCSLAMVLLCATGAEARQRSSRGKSKQNAQRSQQMQKQMQYQQQEMRRVQSEIAAKQEAIFKQFDENGDGRLVGVEKAKYEKLMRDIKTGHAPNPLADVKPMGQGPRDAKGSAASGKK